MDACFDSLQMFPRLTPASVTLRRGCLPRLAAEEDPQLTPLRASPSAVDARALARMYFFRTALPGVATIACTKALAISHVPAPDAPANAAEGALATPSSLHSSSLIPGPSVTPAPLTRPPSVIPPLLRHSCGGRSKMRRRESIPPEHPPTAPQLIPAFPRSRESIPGGAWMALSPFPLPSFNQNSYLFNQRSINLQSKPRPPHLNKTPVSLPAQPGECTMWTTRT